MCLQGADQLSFGFYAHRPVVVQRHAGQLSSDAGLLPIREFDERRQYTARMAACLSDARTAPDHTAVSMLRQRLYGIRLINDAAAVLGFATSISLAILLRTEPVSSGFSRIPLARSSTKRPGW